MPPSPAPLSCFSLFLNDPEKVYNGNMIVQKYLQSFLEMTSWRTTAPPIGSFIHIYAAIVTIGAAFFFAVKFSYSTEKKRMHILTGMGWVLLIMELYKQFFYFYIVNDGAFDWWFFPFQLCSVPMYMCILLPFVSKKLQTTFLTFMTGFTFVSALAALIYPEDMLRSYISLTAHGFIWHGILLFISLLIAISGMADLSIKGFGRSVVLFLVLCAAAVLINVLAEPLAQSGAVPDSYPNMFYLSPYHPSDQPFVGRIESMYGRPAAMASYIGAIIAGAGVTDLIFSLVNRRK